MAKNKIQKSRKGCFIQKVLACVPAFVPLTMASPVLAQATIIISATADLNFGSVSVVGAGTVTMSHLGVRSTTGGVNAIVGSGLEAPGVIAISGSTGLAIDISMGAGTYAIDDAGAGAPMNVDTFNINGLGAVGTITLTTVPMTFPIGARLNVAAGQAGGSYTGTYTVNANYQ